MFSFLFDIIAPKKCYGCKKIGEYLCEDCMKKIYLHSPYCYICKEPLSKYLLHSDCKKKNQRFIHIDQIIVWSHYKNTVLKKMIQDFKYYGRKGLSQFFSRILIQMIQNNIPLNKKTLIVYPPMYFLKQWKRGYNQSELLAQDISKNGGFLFTKDIFKKIKSTKQQSKLSFSQRQENLKDSYMINSHFEGKIKGKNIIIVDDVISTGTTVREMAKLLKQQGALKITVLIIASD